VKGSFEIFLIPFQFFATVVVVLLLKVVSILKKLVCC
jgi:hypothetical protein